MTSNILKLNILPIKKITCQNCVYYRLTSTPHERMEQCTLFIFNSTPQEPEIKYIDTSYCRNHESLCVPSAKLFKPK